MKKNGKIILLCIGILCVLMAAMYFIYQNFVPKAQAGEKHVTISIVYDDGTQKDTELDTDAAYVNGEYGTLNIARQPLEDGGHYTIAYETF